MPFINKIKTVGLMDAVQEAQPKENEFALFWLGQAGFLIKTASGRRIAIDPCLSDFCEHAAGLKRLMPAVCSPEEFCCDILLISHEHEDHFDEELIAQMAASGRVKEIWGPVSIRPLIEKLGLEALYTCLEYGEKRELPEISILPVFSDHGPETPNALGFIFEIPEMRLYYAGDTSYSPELLTAAFDARPDIAIMPINGEFGNLNGAEAYRLAKEIGCRALIPCHYWMYAIHGAFPLELLRLGEKSSDPKVVWLAQGEGWIAGPDLT